jgi:diguanylate cyclase (GGDEF)-like protein
LAEQVLHDFARLLEQADNREDIESSLNDAVHRLTGARSACWIRADESAPTVERREREAGLDAASQDKGKLRFSPSAGNTLASSPAARERLKTLCMMAGLALDRLEARDASGPSPSHGRFDSGADVQRAFPGLPLETVSDVAAFATNDHPPLVGVLHDATFLNAVLPYALAQARRYGEPLSVLCVAVDRLTGVRDLLGEARADRAVRNVGQYIARVIRSSDIVARLDDDRIVAVLLRAELDAAWKVAQQICRTAEHSPTLLQELPDLTLSIGVAEFPSSADTVFALLDAADHALSMAKKHGRNRAIAAGSLPTVDAALEACST